MIDRLARPTWQFAAALGAAWVAMCGAFYLFPDLDIATSRLFFENSACDPGRTPPCGRFWPDWITALAAWRSFFHVLPSVAVLAVAVWLVADRAHGRRLADPAARLKGALVSAFALGPGLLVNVALKDHWGRPRPNRTVLFGGDLPFIPAGEPSSWCTDNCSFVSGEAAGVVILPLLALLAPTRWRATFVVAGIIVALATALLRVSFGAHWLSDVLLGGLSTLVVFAALKAGLDRLALARAGRPQ